MKRKRILSVLIVLTLVFIWGNSLLSREASARISDRFVEGFYMIAEKLGWGEGFEQASTEELLDSSHIVRKAAHVTEYAVLAVLLFLRLTPEKGKREWIAFAASFAVGMIDETIQIFSHRGSQVKDVFIDAFGAALGIFLISLILHIFNKKASR